MRFLPLVAFLAVLAGCSAPETTTTTPSATPPPQTAEPTKPDPALTAQQKDPSFNVKRVYQLKDLDSRTIKVGKNTLKVWIMNNMSKREEGMMWLTEKEVKDNEGMLFVFSDEQPRTFWMQNTVLPLDIAYITSKGKVLNIAEGKSFDESGLPSKGSAQYVLELKKGMCGKFGIKAGMTLDLPKDVKSEDTGG